MATTDAASRPAGPPAREGADRGRRQVGFNIARYPGAATGYDVTVIDQRVELVQKIGDSLDIQAMVGFASHPGALARPAPPTRTC